MPCIPAISSHSLGRAWVHDLPSKLDEAARVGLDVELFFEDLEYLANSLPTGSSTQRQLEAARIIRSWCDARGISIVCLQPFMHYEGLRDRDLHSRRVAEMRHWLNLVAILRTDIIAIPSTFLSTAEISGDIDLIVDDLRVVADLAAEHQVKIAYEALAWGTYINTWEQAYDVVQRVNRWNFGLCLDTFNLAGKVFADPSTASRETEDAEDAMDQSLARLRTIDASKILFVQVVSAAYLSQPLVRGHEYYDPHQDPRMSWSRTSRLFYGERSLGAYLPVKAVLDVILNDLNFEGHISAELFNVSLTEVIRSVPRDHAERAAESFRKIARDCDVCIEPARTTPRRDSPMTCSRAQL